jgi:hypothetical protein
MPRRQSRGISMRACRLAWPCAVAATSRLLVAASDPIQIPTVADSVRPLGEHLTNKRSGCVVVRLTNIVRIPGFGLDQ